MSGTPLLWLGHVWDSVAMAGTCLYHKDVFGNKFLCRLFGQPQVILGTALGGGRGGYTFIAPKHYH